KQRQKAEYFFLIREFQDVIDSFELGENIAVRKRNTLWRSCRAARIHQRGEIVVLCGRRLGCETVREFGRGPVVEGVKAIVRIACVSGRPVRWFYFDILAPR